MIHNLSTVLKIFRPYPGVALAVTEHGTVLLGVPADAYKSTKFLCNTHQLAFPRILVAPQKLLLNAASQFNPEFFLYDFLFLYGAAFDPELAHERLLLVMDKSQIKSVQNALRITLNGPTRQEMAAYRDENQHPILNHSTIEKLSVMMDYMALKKDNEPRSLNDSLRMLAFERNEVLLFDGALKIARDGPNAFIVSEKNKSEYVDLTITSPVTPFATLPTPQTLQTPLEFGIKTLGTRSGFDLTGPTTGFIFWLNGRIVIYDGPVGTRYLLESQGISPEDIDAVILSHCHEDHMGAFIELVLAGARPRVITAEPIYRSALIKLACYFQTTEEEVSHYLDYQRITPHEPFTLLGSEFNFFYTAHAIPTIGVSVTKQDHLKRTHRIQISGDNMHHDGLENMLRAGAIDQTMFNEMRHLIPDEVQQNALFFADVGESIIHGHPKDWQHNANHIVYYHCEDNDYTRSFNHPVAELGQLFSHIEAAKIHPIVPMRLLKALSFLEMQDIGFFTSLLFSGALQTLKCNDTIDATLFGVVISGVLEIKQHDQFITTLKPGEFFGPLLPNDTHSNALLTAQTPTEILTLDATIFHEHIEKFKLTKVFATIAENRPRLEKLALFGELEITLRNQLAKAAHFEQFSPKEAILKQYKQGDDIYILLQGSVNIVKNEKIIVTLSAQAEPLLFGEMAAINPQKLRSADVIAKTNVQILRIPGELFRHIYRYNMSVRYGIDKLIKQRL